MIGLVGSLLGTLALLAQRASSTTAGHAAETDVRRSLEVTLARVAQELRDASRGALNPDPAAPFWTDGIAFQTVSQLAAGGVAHSAQRRLQLVEDPGDPVNGLDDDGDGVVDERLLQLWREDGGAPIVLARNLRALGAGEELNGLDDDGDGLVDEPGFCIVRDGSALRIEATIERPDGNGSSVVLGGVTTAWLQNE